MRSDAFGVKRVEGYKSNLRPDYSGPTSPGKRRRHCVTNQQLECDIPVSVVHSENTSGITLKSVLCGMYDTRSSLSIDPTAACGSASEGVSLWRQKYTTPL